ncbi:hypothetical protein [uncultured Clostridium sp.]|uniref:hypothetical protein n=1 Tax=uncultured Clostridium sp. TaxID=59620 RepID=UPI002614FB69|nr:hypothetical protein [uncultured Clostridium sp.]
MSLIINDKINNSPKNKPSKLSIIGSILFLLILIIGFGKSYFSSILIGTFGIEAIATITGYTLSDANTLSKSSEKTYNYTPTVKTIISGKEVILTRSPVNYSSKEFTIGQRLQISYIFKSKPIFIIKNTFYWANRVMDLAAVITIPFLIILFLLLEPRYQTIAERKALFKKYKRLFFLSIIPLILWAIALIYKGYQILNYPKNLIIPLRVTNINNIRVSEILFVYAVLIYIKIFIDFLVFKKRTWKNIRISILLIVISIAPLFYLSLIPFVNISL